MNQNRALRKGWGTLSFVKDIWRGRRVVAVGIRVTSYPPRRSGRADFPHPALASGRNAHPARRIGMVNAGRGKPAVDESFHPPPWDTTSLAPVRQNLLPETTHSVTK